MTGPADFTHLSHKALDVAGRSGDLQQDTPHGPADAPQTPPAPNRPLRIGLVLAGGGAKGAYELGVLDCMAEMGAQVSAIAGTSIGALNGAVLASEETFFHGVEQLARFWERFS
ncbi:patatin-like phospholipase family protein, partial [Streptomyces bicolor]|uniref:patatin-like phospholipase family protein n=1 Tax=Streptomyces bicolor TaxID=66874 RepID=UPI0004E19C36